MSPLKANSTCLRAFTFNSKQKEKTCTWRNICTVICLRTKRIMVFLRSSNNQKFKAVYLASKLFPIFSYRLSVRLYFIQNFSFLQCVGTKRKSFSLRFMCWTIIVFFSLSKPSQTIQLGWLRIIYVTSSFIISPGNENVLSMWECNMNIYVWCHFLW